MTDTPKTEKKKSPFFKRLGRVPRELQQSLYKSDYLYMLFCFLVPIALFYIIYVIKGIYPFTDGSPLVLDLNAQYVSFFEGLRSFVYGDADLLYSFSRSLGGEFMGMYAYYIASPLSYIVALFPQDRIQEAILCIMLLKSGLCGLSFSFFLHKHSRKPNKLLIFLFSVIYALSSYAVVQQNNTMWIDALILLPLVALGLERLITAKKFKLYAVSLTLTVICNYYIGYMVCIFCVLYFFYFYFSKPKSEINPTGEKKHFIRAFVRFGLFSLLCAAIAAFMLIAAYYSLGFGKSGFSMPSWSMAAKFDILDFFTKFLVGAYDTVEPVGMPFVYCGILTLFLVPAYFLSKRIAVREKIAAASILAVFLISFFTRPIDLIWHGFSTPNWLNGRYSFLFIFMLLILAYKGFGALRELGAKFLVAIAGLLILFVAVAQKYELKAYITSDNRLRVFGCIWFSIFFIIVSCVLLSLLAGKRLSERAKKSTALVLVSIVCVELLCNGAMSFIDLNNDVRFAKYSNYYNKIGSLRPVVNELREFDKGFYRFEKTTHRTRNDNFALGIKGLTNSTSTLNADAIALTHNLGYLGRSHLTMYRGGTPFTDSLLGIKYVIDEKDSDRFDGIFNEISDIESPDYKVMQNPYALSLAFGVNSSMKDFSLEKESEKKDFCFFEEYNDMLFELTKKNNLDIFYPINSREISQSGCDVNERFSAIECTTKDSEGYVTFSYTAVYTGKYYFYAPFAVTSDTPDLEITVGYMSKQSYLGDESDHIFYAGTYNEGDIIQIKIEIPENNEVSFNNRVDFLWYLEENAYTEAMEKLLDAPQLELDQSSTDSRLTGKITTVNSDQMILTTIPYDKGWNVYVDGIKLEHYEAFDAMMAFDIKNSGEHTVKFVYMPSCYIIGFTASAIGALVFLGLCVLEFIMKKTKLKNNPLFTQKDFGADIWEPFESTDTSSLPEKAELPTQERCESDSTQDALEAEKAESAPQGVQECSLPDTAADVEENQFKED